MLNALLTKFCHICTKLLFYGATGMISHLFEFHRYWKAYAAHESLHMSSVVV